MDTFETPTPVKLIVRNPAGRIEIRSSDGQRTEVDILPLRRDAASTQAADETTVDMRTKSSESIVEIAVPSRVPSRGTAQVHVRAQVPHGTSLHVTGASADVEAHGRFGSVGVKTASGDIDFDSADAAVKLESASGDVRVVSVAGDALLQTASGDVEVGQLQATGKIQTASGDVHVGEARSSLKVLSASGDQVIDTVSQGGVSLQSASGDLRIGVKQGSILWIDAKSVSGSTTSELEPADAPVDSSGPHLEIRASTMSGDIALVRSEQVPA